MWQSIIAWFDKLVTVEEDTQHEGGSSLFNKDNDEDDDYSTNPDEIRAVVAAELSRIESRITESEEALYGCQSKIAALPAKIQTLFEALEEILMDSFDADAHAAQPSGEHEENGEAARQIGLEQREVKRERARQAARGEVMVSVSKLLAHRDRLEEMLVRLEVNLRTLEVQRDRVKTMLSTQADETALERGALVPIRPSVPDMMFEMEIRDPGDGQ